MDVEWGIGRCDGMWADFYEVGERNTFGVLSIILRRTDSPVGMGYWVDYSCVRGTLQNDI